VFTFNAMAKAKNTTVPGGRKLLVYDYEDAWWRLTEQVFDSFHMLDALLRFFPPARSPHAGPFRYTQDDRTLDQHPDFLTYEASAEADLREGDIEGHTAFIFEFAQSRVRIMAAQSFARLSEVTDLTGNSVDNGGQPFSVETFLRAVEQIELRFVGDEELAVGIIGHPQAELTKCFFVAPPGALVGFVHPDKLEKVTQAAWTKEQQERFERIIARKREEQRAAKRTRRLS
jgi:hypothetical protein